MMWDNRQLQSPADYVAALEQLRTREQADAFKRAYLAAGHPAMEDNLGYLTGYMGREDARRVCDLLAIEHPIFGKDEWTTGELLLLGMEAQRAQMDHPDLPLREAGARARSAVRFLRATHGRADHEEDDDEDAQPDSRRARG